MPTAHEISQTQKHFKSYVSTCSKLPAFATVRLWPCLSNAYSWNLHWSLTSSLLDEKHNKAENTVITTAGAHTLHSHILITHQTTQCWNNLKITACTQQGKSVIRQLCKGNIKRERSFLANSAWGWLLERGLLLTVSFVMGFCWAKTDKLHFWGPSAGTAPHEMDTGDQSDSMLKTAVTSALLDVWKRLIQPFPACFPECRIKWDRQWVQAPHWLSLPLTKGSL